MSIIRSMLLRPLMRRRNARRLSAPAPAGIVEETFVSSGGMEYWMTIRGEDRDNPILFFLHGGPGAGHTMFNSLTRPWEKYFTVVQWDQRGSGKTLRRNGPSKRGELSLAQLERDSVAVAEHVLEHLGTDKVILVASSVGSTFGAALAKHRPDLLHAYVGTDQNTCASAQSLSYRLTLEWLRDSGNDRGARAVERIGPYHRNWSVEQFEEMAQWTIKANPAIPNMVKDIIFPALMSSPTHSLRDIRDIGRGIKLSTRQLYKDLLDFDVRVLGVDFAVPFFIFQGDSDAITPTAAAFEYFQEIRAPHKEFVLIKHCGHLAAFTRPEQFLHELVAGVRPLAAAVHS